MVVQDHLVQGVLHLAKGTRAVGRRGGGRVDRGRALRVVVRGALEHRRQEGALTRVELDGVLVEVRTRGGLDAVGVAAVVRGVQVAGEDVVLLDGRPHLDRDEDLLELAADRLGLVVKARVLHILLGDGGATLGLTARRHVEDGARDALRVDAAVGVEGLVLLGDDRVPHCLGNLREIDDLAVGLTARRHHLGAVGPVIDVVLRLRGLCHVRDAHHGVSDARDCHEASYEADEQAAHQLPRGHPARGSVLARPRVVDKALLAGRRGTPSAPPGPVRAARPTARAVRRPATAASTSLGCPSGIGSATVRALLTSHSILIGRRPGGRARGAARRPEDDADWPRRAAARPPPWGCDGLRRCSLIERLLLGQAHPGAPGNGSRFPVPRSTDVVVVAFTVRHEDEDALGRHSVPGDVHAAQTTHRRNPPSPQGHPKSGNLPPLIGDVTPFTLAPLVAPGEAFYRADVSSRYISTR